MDTWYSHKYETYKAIMFTKIYGLLSLEGNGMYSRFPSLKYLDQTFAKYLFVAWLT